MGQKKEGQCGLGSWNPEWLQKFASKKSFIVVYSLLAIVQTMSWSYFSATISTLEKRFKISSQTAGIVMSGNEISQILFSIVLSHYGSKGHRPFWMALGVLFSAFASFLIASPQLFYGSGEESLLLTVEYGENSQMVNQTGLIEKTNKLSLCESTESKMDNDCHSEGNSPLPLILIFFSQFSAGIAVVLFHTLGSPFLDDNVKHDKSPMMFGIASSLRLVGPTFGYLLAGACVRLYVNPQLTPLIKSDDPRWIGAWWLGWVIIGTITAAMSILLCFFPRQLPRTAVRKEMEFKRGINSDDTQFGMEALSENGSKSQFETSKPPIKEEEESDKPKNETGFDSLKELPKALMDLMKNKINLFNTFAAVFYLFSAIGYWTYMPKYMETIFLQTAANASFISGGVSIFFQAVGLLVSGFVISKYQPSARKLAAWNVALGLLATFAAVGFTQFGCDPGNLKLREVDLEANVGGYNLTTECNNHCKCPGNKMYPVCHKEENQIFFSPCHAGCETFVNGTLGNCSCVTPNDTVHVGTCSTDCYKTFIVFIVVSAFIKLFESSGRIGNLLVQLRCVRPQEKGLAIGLSLFLFSIFAMLPSPIIYGKIIDSVCLVWGTKCGKRGNCWLYDGQKLRYVFNLTASVFLFIGTAFDGLVWYHVKDLDLYDENKNIQRNKDETNKKEAKSNGTKNGEVNMGFSI